MKDPLFTHFFSKWKQRIAPADVCVVALSGGIDSMALYELAKEAAALHGNRVVAVHVDHKMREESTRQARQLQEWTGCEVLSLTEMHSTNDIENALRTQRYQKLKSRYDSLKATMLLTGHHADDLAETVLKRIFEGAAIPNLVGIEEETTLFGMKVLRPMLGLVKAELEQYLERRGIPHIEDSSNTDELFTRNRIRHTILPMLEKSFGKGIQKNLVALSEEASLLKKEAVKEKGQSLDQLNSMSDYELHLYIVRHFPQLTRAEKKLLRSLIRQRKCGKQVQRISVKKHGLVEI